MQNFQRYTCTCRHKNASVPISFENFQEELNVPLQVCSYNCNVLYNTKFNKNCTKAHHIAPLITLFEEGHTSCTSANRAVIISLY